MFSGLQIKINYKAILDEFFSSLTITTQEQHLEIISLIKA